MWPEALPPLLIIAGSLTFTGLVFKFIDRLSNDGKPKRHGLEEWDKAMIARDKRITGKANKQQAL